jgi:hypothetical protein
MATWNLLCVLPNINGQKGWREPVEADFLAIVPRDDERVSHLGNKSAATDALLANFHDAFGNPCQPTPVLIRSDHNGGRLSADALLSFRNAVALPAVVMAWIAYLNNPLSAVGGTRWSDYFDIYPWSPTKPTGELGAFGPEVHADLQDPASFQGQPSPALFASDLICPTSDRHLRDLLLQHWKRRFSQHQDDSHLQRLYRSLEVAYEAARVPFEAHFRVLDIGIRLSLWVSAIEILWNPRVPGPMEVLSKIDDVQYALPELGRRDSCLLNRNGKPNDKKAVTLPQLLYRDLCHLRNDFLHGNQVEPSQVFGFGCPDRPQYLSLAPLLWRIFVMKFMGEYTTTTDQSTPEAEMMAELAECTKHEFAERALLTALKRGWKSLD